MTIVFITYEYPPDTGKGGIGTYTQQMVKKLADEGWRVFVVCGGKVDSKSKIGTATIVRTRSTGNSDFPKAALTAFGAIASTEKIDLIETPEIGANASAIRKAYPQIPLVVRLHAPNHLVESFKKTYTPLKNKLRFTLGALKRGYWDAGYWRKYDYKNDQEYQQAVSADFITTPSSTMKNWAVKNWKINADRIIVSPNPFTPPPALLKLSVENGAAQKTILFYGRLNVLKGCVVATDVMLQFLSEFKDWKFLVVGDDGPGPTLEQVSMRKYMQDKLRPVLSQVEFKGGVGYEALPEVFSRASIVLIPSLFESYSYVCAEAMAAGMAIVGSSTSAMIDLVDDGLNGFLAKPEGRSELLKKLKKIATNQLLRMEFGVAARKKILQMAQTTDPLHYYKKMVGNAIG